MTDSIADAAQGASNLLRATMGPSEEQQAKQDALNKAARAPQERTEPAYKQMEQAFADDDEEFDELEKAGKIDEEFEKAIVECDAEETEAAARKEFFEIYPEASPTGSLSEGVEMLLQEHRLGHRIGKEGLCMEDIVLVAQLQKQAEENGAEQPELIDYYNETYHLMRNCDLNFDEAMGLLQSSPPPQDYPAPMVGKKAEIKTLDDAFGV